MMMAIGIMLVVVQVDDYLTNGYYDYFCCTAFRELFGVDKFRYKWLGE